MGLHTNADSKVTDADRRLAEQEAYNAELVDKKIKATGTIGSSKHAVILDKTADLSVTLDQLNDVGRQEYRPVVPIAVEPRPDGGFDYILTEPDYHAVREGKVCAKCLEWQSDVLTENCVWRGRDVGCGNRRNLEADFNYMRMEKPK